LEPILSCKYYARLEVNNSDKHPNVLQYGINNGCKGFVVQAHERFNI
jgi:hypothetical protein